MKTIVPVLLLAIFLSGCSQNYGYVPKHFPSRIARVHNVGLATEVHTAILNNYFGLDKAPPPFPEESQIRSELIAATIAQLEQHGFRVIEIPSANTNHIVTGDMIHRFSYNGKLPRPDAIALADNMNLDAVCFLEAKAFRSTQHRENATDLQNFIALLACVTGRDGSIHLKEFSLQITLVDGKTGNVLWWMPAGAGDLDKKSPLEVIEDIFKFFPAQ